MIYTLRTYVTGRLPSTGFNRLTHMPCLLYFLSFTTSPWISKQRAAFLWESKPQTGILTPTSWAWAHLATQHLSRWQWRMWTSRLSSRRHLAGWLFRRTPKWAPPSGESPHTTLTTPTMPSGSYGLFYLGFLEKWQSCGRSIKIIASMFI